MLYIVFVVGILFLVVGGVRMNKDFKEDKKKNSFIQLLLTGQASGIGQFLSGVLFIIIGVIGLFLK